MENRVSRVEGCIRGKGQREECWQPAALHVSTQIVYHGESFKCRHAYAGMRTAAYPMCCAVVAVGTVQVEHCAHRQISVSHALMQASKDSA